MTKTWLICLLVLFTACGLAIAYPQEYIDGEGNLRLENEYIAIFVNLGPENEGRFALDVTGGNPEHDGDNNKPLIYGHPRPWTSYTTVRIDGENYVFGGETSQRAGRDGQYGEVTGEPQVVDGEKIITETRMGDVVVTQELSFIESTTTGFPDTAQIRYDVTNEGNVEKRIGLRVVLDTMLGPNDGAPFRVRDQEVLQDKVLIREDIPEFWQAFDSLEDPVVMAQGDLRGPDLTPPDEVYMTNWGSLADGVWDFNFRPGREFYREGEFELDSAIALYWTADWLSPGETKSYVTSYGLAGIDIVPGLLSVGLTAPGRVIFDDFTQSFQVMAYMQNNLEVTARDVEVGLDLPEGYEVIEGSQRYTRVGELEAGGRMQFAWQVAPTRDLIDPEMLNIQVRADASNTDGTRATRQVEVLPPAALELHLEGPTDFSFLDHEMKPNPFPVYGRVTNTGGSPAYGVRAVLALPPGLSLVRPDQEHLELGILDPGEVVEFRWLVRSHGRPGEIPMAMEVSSRNTRDTSFVEILDIPEWPQSVYLKWDDPERLKPGRVATALVVLGNLGDGVEFEFDLEYPADLLKPIYISRGQLMVSGEDLLEFNRPEFDPDSGVITGFAGELRGKDYGSGVLARIHFLVRDTGEGMLELKNVKVSDIYGAPFDLGIGDLQFNIE